MKSPSLFALAAFFGVSTAAQAAEPVVWTNAVGVTVSGNSLTRGAAAAAWNAGASSVNVIRDGYGYVECTVAETNLRRMCGLSHGDANQDYLDIDFAAYLDVGGSLKVYEGSVSPPWTGGTYAAGDKVRVQVANGVVTYLRNGVTVYTSTKKAQYPLRVDTALYDPGATLQDVVVGASGWTGAVGVSVSRDTLTKTGAAGWNSGIASANQITTGDGYVEFTAGQNTTSRAAGLASGDTGQMLADIEYAIHLRDDGIVTVTESGTAAGDFGGYIGTDRFRVELQGGTVRYLKNGAVFYASLVAPTYPLRADTAFDTVGGVLEDVLVEPLVWSSVTGATATGSTLVKTAGAGWNAGATASNAIASGDGWLEATAIETNTQRVVGLESGGAASTWSDIDHAIELAADGTVKVHESGVTRGTYGSYANGDLLRVEIRDGIVRYLRNGTLLYTSTLTPAYPLHADTALYTTGATLYHVTMGDIVWLDDVGVEIRGNRLRKTASTTWGNAGAYSTRAIDSGFVEMVVAERGSSRMLGLSHGNVNSSYTDIDYAIYPATDNLLYIYENGTQRGTNYGSYVGGDRLKVRLQSGVVTYLKNDAVIYTSAVVPVLPLRLDVAFYDVGGTIGALTYPGAAALDTLSPPVLAPGTNTYTAAQNVTMTSVTNATIRYTTNGSEPNSGSTLYSGPVNVNTLTTLKARAFKNGYNDSATASATYTFNYGIQPAPTLTPAQTFITSGSVTMSAGAGTTIRYTTNGTEPTAASTEYTAPVTVELTTTIRAKAFKLDWTMSPTTAVTYTVKVATPVLSLASGTHAAAAPITVTLPTPAATAHYTISGVDPASPVTNEQPILSGGNLFAGNYTLKVRSYKAGCTASDVATATYTVTGSLGPGDVAAGGSHSLAALPDGRVWGWGFSNIGQTGTGYAVYEGALYQPADGMGLTGIVQVAAGQGFGLALRTDGRFYSFGIGSSGELGLGDASHRPTPVLNPLTNVTALAAGEVHALALRSDGTVWAWGSNGSGQLGFGTPPAQQNAPGQVEGLEGRTIVAIAAGDKHSLALDSDGRVWAWGLNTSYQLGDGTTTQRNRPVLVDGLLGIVAIGSGTGANHSLAVRGGDRAVFAWGVNYYGTLGDGTNVVRSVPVRVQGLTNVASVATNGFISTAVTVDGVMWSWGAAGAVGDGSLVSGYTDRRLPVVLAPNGILKASPGNGISSGHALALSDAGVIWAWGDGYAGKIGDGNAGGSSTRYQPVRITEPGFVRKVGTPYILSGTYNPGQYPWPVSVGFTTLTAGASIYYTTDGNEPTTGAGSTLYSGPFQVTQNTTLKVRAFKSGVAPSNTETMAYTIAAATPVISPSTGTYPSAQTVTITTTTPGAIIRYTTDTTVPTEASTQYTAPLSIGVPTMLRATAWHASMTPSSTASASYSFNVPGSAPAFAPAPGTYVGPVSVTITGPAGATIRYTLDGGEPTLSSTAYTAPVALSATTTLKAKAFLSGQAPSATTTGVYTIQLEAPTLTPVGGSVPAGQVVTLGHADPTVQLRYTTDGVDPSGASNETVVAPASTITIGAGLTLKVRAYKTGNAPSEIVSGVYTVTGSSASPGVIATGAQFTMFAKPDGTAWMWGANGTGQLGNGSASNNLFTPTQVAELSGITSLDGGVGHGVVRKSDGTVWTSGQNGSGQLGIGTTGGSRTTYAALTHAALTSPNSVASIASGWSQVLALRTDGTVWAWGANNLGQLGNGGGTTAQPSPVQVGPPGTPLTSVVQVAAARDFSLALKSDGTVWAWGSNDSGQLGNNATGGSSNVPVQVQISGGAALTGVAEISAGSFHGLARKTDGTVWSWGWNGYGQLGPGGAPGTPPNRAFAAQVVQLAQVKAIAGGSLHSLAVRQDGSVWAWGHGNGGELGTGGVGNFATPQQAIVISGIHSVAAGDYASAAVGLDGSVWAWGANYQGEVGDGTETPTSTPKKIAEPGTVWTVGTPKFSPSPGSVYAVTTVTLTTSTPGALIHYTTDGSTPTQAHPSVASGGTVVLNVSSVLKARAYKADWSPSAAASGAYTLYLPAVTVSVPTGTYNVEQTIVLSHTVPGTEIRYTTDSTPPTATSTLYTSPLVVSESVTSLQVRPYKTGWSSTGAANYGYTLKVGTPVLSVAGGAYGSAQSVIVTCVTPGAALRYTLDGQEPTESSPTVTTGGTVLVDRSATLMVKGWRSGWSVSDTAVATYSISQGTAATPTFSPAPGTFTAVQPVTIKSTTAGATLRYTTDGTTPGIQSAIYRGPVTVDATMTLRARAFKEDWTASATAVGAYTIDLANTVAPVTFAPPGGVYTTQRTVTLTTATPAALIHYTVDGTTPTTASPSVASGGTVLVDQGLPLRAFAVKATMTSSPIRRADYQITGAVSSGAVGDGGGAQSGMALKTDGTVWAWGWNPYGQVGSGHPTNQPVPVQVPGLSNMVAIAMGASHALAVKADGTVWAWGQNNYGQIGNGTSGGNQLTPVQVTGLTNAVAVGAHWWMSFALTADGKVYAWGTNANYRLGLGTGGGTYPVPTEITQLSDIKAISIGIFNGMALKADGTVMAWGDNSAGQIGDGTIAPRPTPVPVPGLANVTRIAAGHQKSHAIRTDGSENGTLYGWGLNTSGDVGDGTLVNRYLPVRLATGVRATSSRDGVTLVTRKAVGGPGAIWGIGYHRSDTLSAGSASSSTVPQYIVPGAYAELSAGKCIDIALRRNLRLLVWAGCYPNANGFVLGPNTNAESDPDGDGLQTAIEWEIGTDGWNADTNGDGISDGAALLSGQEALSPDVDGDGLDNAVERAIGTDPFNADTDGDGHLDGADAFPLDPTRWALPPPDPGDTTPPIITLTEPTNAVLISVVPPL